MNLETAGSEPKQERVTALTPELRSNALKVEALAALAAGRLRTQECLYQEELPGQYEFKILTAERDGDRYYTFRVLDLDPSEEAPIAEFTFEELPDHIDMLHRLVNSQDVGISGTDMLNKAETFFNHLFDRRVLRRKDLLINAGQVHVVSWARKNGFSFINDREAQEFEKILAGHTDLVTDAVITDRNGFDREGYITSKENLAVIDSLTYSPSREELFELTKRFHLVKDITPSGSTERKSQ